MTNFTEIYNEYKPQIEKLNKQFKKLQKHTQDLDYTNLKLYDVAFYVGDNEKLLKHFENFCECEYDYFQYWLEENNLKTEQLGRTSSFYFYSLDKNPYSFYDFDIYDMKDDKNIFDTLGYGLESELETLFISNDFYQAYYNLENDLKYYLLDYDELDDLETELEDAIEELEEYLQAYYEEIKAVRRAYKWLEDYKKYQVESFKDFVENNEY